MPTWSFSIGGEKHDIAGKTSEQLMDMAKKEYNKKKEEKVECHDCGEISKCYDKRQGVSMGGEIYDYDIGDCCKDNYEMEVSEIMWREKKYLREMATGDLYTWDTCVKIGTMDKHGKVLLLEEQKQCVYDVNEKPIQTIKDFKKEFGELLEEE